MLVTKTFLVHIDFHNIDKNTMEVNATINGLVTNINLKLKKETHTGWNKWRGEYI